jgi:hypothetical protein
MVKGIHRRRSAAVWLKTSSSSTSLFLIFCSFFFVMALDSSATFFERMQYLELGAHEEHFKTIGWITFSKLAYATTYTPGGDEDKYTEEITVKGLKDANHPDKGVLRRLFFEAYTLSAGDLKSQLESPTLDAPRVVPNAERLARRRRAAEQLPGLELKGELDISDALLDRTIDMYDRNGIYYLGLELCTKRQTSLMGPQRRPSVGARAQRRGHLPVSEGRRSHASPSRLSVLVHACVAEAGAGFNDGRSPRLRAQRKIA